MGWTTGWKDTSKTRIPSGPSVPQCRCGVPHQRCTGTFTVVLGKSSLLTFRRQSESHSRQMKSQRCRYAWFSHTLSQFAMVKQMATSHLCKDFSHAAFPSPSLCCMSLAHAHNYTNSAWKRIHMRDVSLLKVQLCTVCTATKCNKSDWALTEDFNRVSYMAYENVTTIFPFSVPEKLLH